MKWQYKTTKIGCDNFAVGSFKLSDHNEIDKFLNEFGALGWELVSTTALAPPMIMNEPYTKEVVLFFKRPLDEIDG